jgi:hypothetical protein
LAFGYLTGRLFYGEMVHASGLWAIWCLMGALAVTPLRRVFPRQAWTAWLLPRRRYLGVAAFAYAALHAAVYVLRLDLPRIIAEALEAGLRRLRAQPRAGLEAASPRGLRRGRIELRALDPGRVRSDGRVCARPPASGDSVSPARSVASTAIQSAPLEFAGWRTACALREEVPAFHEPMSTRTNTILVAAVIAAGAVFAQPHAATDPQSQLVARIDELRTASGPTTPELIGPLHVLGMLYQETEQHALAIVALEEARHVTRVNRGLSSIDEALLLKQQIRSEDALGFQQRAWDHELDMLTIASRTTAPRFSARSAPESTPRSSISAAITPEPVPAMTRRATSCAPQIRTTDATGASAMRSG